MTTPVWLTARPIAHRGWHGASGALENTLSAARAAIAGGFAIECDIQLSADGEAIVFHDFTLERLTERQGRVDECTADSLTALNVGDSSDKISTFSTLLEEIAGRAPLICEIKSRFDGDFRLARRAAEIVRQAPGPVALKSFDPEPIAWLRAQAPALDIAHVPLGIIAMADFDDPRAALSPETRRSLAAFTHFDRTQPDFLSFCVDDLPHAAPSLMRAALHRPVMTWTVRTPAQAARARLFAEQIIFEGDPTSWR